MANTDKNTQPLKIVWHIFVFILSFASLAEVAFEFLPREAAKGESSKIFFMALTLTGFNYEIVNSLFIIYFRNNNLEDKIKQGLKLSTDNRIESSLLLEIESDLDSEFSTKDGTYHIIIVSACFDLSEEPFINAIWRNINHNVRYLYVTPEDDQTFINSLISIFIKKGYSSDLTKVYSKVTHSISHICNPELFDVLPEGFDLCVYCKDNNRHIVPEGALGFCCYQSELIRDDFNQHTYAFYYRLSKNGIFKVYNRFSGEFDAERIYQSFFSSKVEKRNSPIHGEGLFCKTDSAIKKGDVILIKGGHELHRSEMLSTASADSYLPIGDDLFLAAKSEEEEKSVRLYMNHSCAPNVGMLDDRTFIAIRSIKGNEELTIDYAFIFNDEFSFKCHCGNKNCRHIITGTDWKDKRLSSKRKYFSPYLQRKSGFN